MTINDHDQFTGLNAVHVAASEGNVKRLVELMDDGAELDVPALGGSIVLSSFTSSLSLSLSLSRFFFFVDDVVTMMMMMMMFVMR